ncbi:hypothetical protein EDD11_002679 [Mortierella claussenii]|nr:hypothetical protein EDD11_002679 [Mortierella claussenii]
MKSTLALATVLAAVATALPIVELETKPVVSLQDYPNGKQQIGGLSAPSGQASTLNTKVGPINYGNLNLGTGMMPSQVVHYGTENQPDRAFVAPKVLVTTAKDANLQISKAEKVKGSLINANVDIGKAKLPADSMEFSKYATELSDCEDEDDDSDDHNGNAEDEDDVDPAKWRPWGWRGRHWRWGWGSGYPGWWRHRRSWWWY